MTELPIGPGTRVTLHFSLALEDGTEVDSNFSGKPATFSVGDGNLLGGFETALFGMTAGQENSFVIEPEKAFGQHNPQNIQRLSKEDFSDDIKLEKGLVCSFEDPSQGELPGVIADFDDQWVFVDFNHPLAGRTIHFSVQILAVEPAVTH